MIDKVAANEFQVICATKCWSSQLQSMTASVYRTLQANHRRLLLQVPAAVDHSSHMTILNNTWRTRRHDTILIVRLPSTASTRTMALHKYIHVVPSDCLMKAIWMMVPLVLVEVQRFAVHVTVDVSAWQWSAAAALRRTVRVVAFLLLWLTHWRHVLVVAVFVIFFLQFF